MEMLLLHPPVYHLLGGLPNRHCFRHHPVNAYLLPSVAISVGVTIVRYSLLYIRLGPLDDNDAAIAIYFPWRLLPCVLFSTSSGNNFSKEYFWIDSGGKAGKCFFSVFICIVAFL